MFNVGFIKDTQFVLPAGGCADIFTLKDIECVRVSLSNGGSFVCGKDQLIKLNDDWCPAIDCCGGRIGSLRVDGVEMCGKHDTFDTEIDDDSHTFGILVAGVVIPVHNIPSVVVHVNGDGDPNKFYKYIPYYVTESKTITRSHVVSDKSNRMIDFSNVVLLGGLFEKVGDEDEAIGGGSQKVGQTH